MVEDMKDRFDHKWRGFGDDGKWQSNKNAVVMWTDKTFRARVKLVVSNLSFYRPNGEEISLEEFVEEVQNFNPDAVDDDLSTLGKSSVPFTPDKRQRS